MPGTATPFHHNLPIIREVIQLSLIDGLIFDISAANVARSHE